MKLTDKIIAKFNNGPRELTDDQLRGLKVRISRRGTKAFYLFYRIGNTRKKYRIGSIDIGISAARKAAKLVKASIALGDDPQAERTQAREVKKSTKTLRTFLDQHYYPHTEQTQRSHGYTRRLIESNFQFLMNRELNNIVWPDIDKWRTRLLAKGIQPQTVNRRLCALKSAMNRAVEWNMLDTSPLNGRKQLKALKNGIVRWLSEEEKTNLLKILNNRIGKAATTIIYILLYTGARPKEVFSLKWSAIDLENKTITLHAAFTKTATTRTIPINNPLARVLSEWQSEQDWLFPGPGINNHAVSISRAWRIIKKEAGLVNLRLYDLRHSFASELVQKGVPLYTVSKLLGHSSVQMTTIYAHLDNGSLKDAVDLL